MPVLSPNLRGILFMVLATGSFVFNDSLLKVAMDEIPPFEALFLRALLGVVLGLPMLAATGTLGQARQMFRPGVIGRNFFELAAAAVYIFAIANAPIADISAMGQLSPMLVMLGAMVFFGERIGRLAMALIGVAFLGAVLVAQPGGTSFQPFALLGLASAGFSAARDLIGRRIGAEVPAVVVAVGASLVTLVGIAVLMLLFERWIMPSGGTLLLVSCSALFVTLGQIFMFSAFRTPRIGAVLPFSYSGTVWALFFGVLIFHAVPNALGLAGIGLILLSGVLVVLIEGRASRRLSAVIDV